MTKRSCSVDGCERPHTGRGWCQYHYDRWRKGGSADAAPSWNRSSPGEPMRWLVEQLASASRGDGCWDWPFALSDNGYGQVWHDGRRWFAHRMSVHLDGRDPSGAVVRHSCDRPRCVNPAHLAIGTQARNMGDAVERGRVVRGTRQHAARLTEEQVRLIRAALADGERGSDLAAAFGVSRQTITNVKRGRSWSWLE